MDFSCGFQSFCPSGTRSSVRRVPTISRSSSATSSSVIFAIGSPPAALYSRLRPIQRWKPPSQLLQLRGIIDDDVRLVGVLRQIVLVIVLRLIEAPERAHFGHDRRRIDPGSLEPGNGAPRCVALGRIAVEDRRAVLRSHVGPRSAWVGSWATVKNTWSSWS